MVANEAVERPGVILKSARRSGISCCTKLTEIERRSSVVIDMLTTVVVPQQLLLR